MTGNVAYNHFLRAKTFIKQRKFSHAIKEFESALAIHPKDPMVRRLLEKTRAAHRRVVSLQEARTSTQETYADQRIPVSAQAPSRSQAGLPSPAAAMAFDSAFEIPIHVEPLVVNGGPVLASPVDPIRNLGGSRHVADLPGSAAPGQSVSGHGSSSMMSGPRTGVPARSAGLSRNRKGSPGLPSGAAVRSRRSFRVETSPETPLEAHRSGGTDPVSRVRNASVFPATNRFFEAYNNSPSPSVALLLDSNDESPIKEILVTLLIVLGLGVFGYLLFL